MISFGAGEPDFDTPERIKDAAVRAIAAGPDEVHRGRRHPRAARRRLRTSSSATTGSTTRPTRSLVSCGAKHTLYNIVDGAGQPGRRGADPEPVLGLVSRSRCGCWAACRSPCRRRRRPASTSTRPRSARAVTPRTKLIVLNSPSNPTGAVFSPDGARRGGQARRRARSVDRLRRVLRGAHLRGPARVHRLARPPRSRRARIVVNTCSKAYAMTGWRIGYAAGPKRDHPGHDRRAEPGHVEPDVGRAVGRGRGARPARRTRSPRWRASSTGAGA